MPKRPRILWIEDSARYELSELLGPVYYARKYKVTLAEDASRAMECLLTQTFDIVIVDIRLPPGHHEAWQKLYDEAKRGQVRAHLGLRILEWLFNENGRVHELIPDQPPQISRNAVAVFTVEGRAPIRDDLQTLGITMFKQKTTMIEDRALLKIIEQLLRQKATGLL